MGRDTIKKLHRGHSVFCPLLVPRKLRPSSLFFKIDEVSINHLSFFLQRSSGCIETWTTIHCCCLWLLRDLRRALVRPRLLRRPGRRPHLCRIRWETTKETFCSPRYESQKKACSLNKPTAVLSSTFILNFREE